MNKTALAAFTSELIKISRFSRAKEWLRAVGGHKKELERTGRDIASLPSSIKTHKDYLPYAHRQTVAAGKIVRRAIRENPSDRAEVITALKQSLFPAQGIGTNGKVPKVWKKLFSRSNSAPYPEPDGLQAYAHTKKYIKGLEKELVGATDRKLSLEKGVRRARWQAASGGLAGAGAVVAVKGSHRSQKGRNNQPQNR